MKARLRYTSIIEVDIELFLVPLLSSAVIGSIFTLYVRYPTLYIFITLYIVILPEAELCSAIFIHVVTMVTPVSYI